MKKLISLFKKSFAYLVWILLFGIIIFMHYKGKRLEGENDALGEDIKRSEKMTQIYLDRNNALIPKIDSLVNENSKLLNQLNDIAKKDKNVIIKYNEKIKVINKFGISDMQSYFDSNFGAGKSSNTR